jgi:hypothetical protein
MGPARGLHIVRPVPRLGIHKLGAPRPGWQPGTGTTDRRSLLTVGTFQTLSTATPWDRRPTEYRVLGIGDWVKQTGIRGFPATPPDLGRGDQGGRGPRSTAPWALVLIDCQFASRNPPLGSPPYSRPPAELQMSDPPTNRTHFERLSGLGCFFVRGPALHYARELQKVSHRSILTTLVTFSG